MCIFVTDAIGRSSSLASAGLVGRAVIIHLFLHLSYEKNWIVWNPNCGCSYVHLVM